MEYPLVSLESLDTWFVCVSFLFMLLSSGKHVCRSLAFSFRVLIWPFSGDPLHLTHTCRMCALDVGTVSFKLFRSPVGDISVFMFSNEHAGSESINEVLNTS